MARRVVFIIDSEGLESFKWRALVARRVLFIR